MTFVDPSRNPLHDPDSGLYHGDVPVDPTVGPVLRPADDPEAYKRESGVLQPADETGDPSEYDELTVEQLRGEARSRGLSGFSTLNKAELVALLEEDDADGDAPTGDEAETVEG